MSIVARPRFQLRSLPFHSRWEVTRRHPYYQDWWQRARAHHHNEPIDHPAEAYLRQAAAAILAAIGVNGDPPDPATSLESLGAEDLLPAWLSGAVHPITFRGLAGLMIAALPKETLGHLGMLFLEAACEDRENEPPKQTKALLDLSTADMPGLNSYPDEPIVSINPAASGRQTNDAIAELLREWKAEREIDNQRDRSDKYADYLRIWDLREGWTGAAYDRTQERKLREIAHQLEMPLSTVKNHYQSAFALIVGRPYSPELWYQVVGPLKLMEMAGQELARLSFRRPLKSKTRRPVPATTLSPNCADDDRQGPASSMSVSNEDLELGELVGDVRALLTKGLTDEEIVDQLDLSPATTPGIAYLRERGGEIFPDGDSG